MSQCADQQEHLLMLRIGVRLLLTQKLHQALSVGQLPPRRVVQILSLIHI